MNNKKTNPLPLKIDPKWQELLSESLSSPKFLKLWNKVSSEYASHQIFPSAENIFNALNLTDPQDIKVIILGQDPYHTPGAAMGLSFSVPKDYPKTPPSLRNIFKELADDTHQPIRENTDLSDWAKQGVLMLNSVLTVRESQAGSHKDLGWQTFTFEIVQKISSLHKNLVFIAWGKYALTIIDQLDTTDHLVINSAHPSPFSAHRGFLGSTPFSKTNAYLKEHGKQPIRWQ